MKETIHFTSWTEFETFGKACPPHTEFFVRKVAKGELWVEVNKPQPPAPLDNVFAEACADAFLGDPKMKCVATGVTEFGITGTVVPRFP